MTKTVSSIAGLLAALKSAKGGDTILLAPGVYDAVALNNFKFKSTVTIASADPTHQAVLSNLSLNNDAYITFKQLSITTSTGTAATVLGSNHIVFTQDTFSGSAIGSGNAIVLRTSDSVTITNSNFGKFGTGINLLTDSNLSITNNVFHDISGADILGTTVTSSTITGNTFSNASSTVASHVDVLNLWQDNAANHVVIDANIYGTTVAAPPPPPATPSAPVDPAVIGGYVNAAHDTSSQTISGTAGAGVLVAVYDNGTKVGTVSANSSGAWSYQVGVLADGSSHSYTVTASDLAGNTSAASAALAFKVDASAPARPGAPADASVISGYVNAAHDTASQTISGTTEAGASVAVYDNGAQVATVTANSSGAWSYQVGALADGSSHSYSITASDLAGNTSAASAALKFTVDASAPAKPGAPADASVINGYVDAAHNTASQAIGGTAEAGALVAVYDNGTQVATVTAGNTGAWTYQVGALATGSSHSYTITATDLAGNTSVASDPLKFTVSPPPPAAPPTGVTEVSSVQQLLSALATAHAGDVIALDAGIYDAATLNNINFSSAVTITSMDQAHQAVLSNLSVGSSSNLTFDHVGVTTSSGTAVNLQDSHGIVFSNDAFSSTASGNAMILRNDSGVTITGSDFTQLGTGINVLTADSMSITNNNFHNMSGDIRGTGLTASTISGNTFADASSTSLDHSDVIALWQDNTANNVTIGANVWGSGTATALTSTTQAVTTSTPVITTTAPSGAQTVTVSTTAQLVTALQSAHAGDVIKLAAGAYNAASLYGLHFSSAVTITSADTANEAVINGGITLDTVSGLTLDHLAITGFSNGYGVLVGNSSNVSVQNLTIENAPGTLNGVGVFVRSSTGVAVSNNEVAWSESGIGHLDDNGLVISNNNIHDLAVDGIIGAGTSNVVISGNSFTNFHMPTGSHPDAIQFFADGTIQNSNVLVADNVVTRGTGDVIQGIFVENTNHIEITGNAMSGTMYNGISLSGVTEGLVSNNFVQGWVDMNSGIITRGGSVDVSVLNNVSQGGIANYQVDGPNPNYVESGTTSVAAAAIGDLSGLNAWLSHHSATTASLADPFFLH